MIAKMGEHLLSPLDKNLAALVRRAALDNLRARRTPHDNP
jgi:hypothetical protein